ncbi:MAG: hypothetical protein R3E95_23275 [Thiolinea sp.]
MSTKNVEKIDLDESDKSESQWTERIELVNALERRLGDHDVRYNKKYIIECCVNYLTRNQQNNLTLIQPNELEIIERSPTNYSHFHHLYSGYDSRIDINDDNNLLQPNALHPIVGGITEENEFGVLMPKSLIQTFKSREPLVFPGNGKQVNDYFNIDDKPPKLCIILPMQFSNNGNIGYFVIKTNDSDRVNYFNKGIIWLLAIVANKLADALRNLRAIVRQRSLKKFSEIFFEK